MYGQTKSSIYYSSSASFSQCKHNYPSNFSTLLPQSQSLSGELNSTALEPAAMPINGSGTGSSSIGSRFSGGSNSSSYMGSPSSPPSCCTSSHPQNCTPAFLQTSQSAHTLQNELHPPNYLPVRARQFFSNGHFDQGDNGLHCHHQQQGGTPLESESVSVILQGMAQVCRYSPEEKKERIERYRTKRSRRNFNKKIQYACRKTLADSRPRVRGRFARNDENEKTHSSIDLQWSQMTVEDDDGEYEHWIYLLHNISSHIVP